MLKIVSVIGPVSSVKNIGNALYDIVALPVHSDNPVEGVKIALIGFMKSLSMESVSMLENFMSAGYTLVQSLGTIAGISMPSRQKLLRPLQNIQCVIDRKKLEEHHTKFKHDSN